MMNTAKHIGRIGALAVALGVGSVRRNLTRVTVSIGVAALVVTAAVTAAPVSTESPTVKLSANSTALLVCGVTCPTPDHYIIETAMSQYIIPTHPGQTITPVAVTTPAEIWPVTGVLRLVGFAFGDPRAFGPGGAAWPDEPWWKLSGLFDVTAGQALQGGADAVEAAMAAYGNDRLVIFGVSQGAAAVNVEKIRLAEQYPAGTKAPDIDFVVMADPNLPNGGLMARFPGLYIPILDFPAGFPASTDTQFDTVEINRQYDGASDLPLYPLNVISLVNAGLGFVYLHTNFFDVSLPTDPKKSPAYQGTHGDTDYYFFQTQDLPLFAPLRQLGVPEPVIDVFEPFFRVLVELGYDRNIPPWEPTPARLIPTTLDPAKVTTDLVNAVGEGVTNALALVGLPAPVSPAPTIDSTGNTEKVAANEAVFQPNSFDSLQSQRNPTDAVESTQPNGATGPNKGSGQQNTNESGSTERKESEPSVQPKPKPSTSTSTPRQPKPFGRPTGQRVVDQRLEARQTANDVAVPRKGRWTTADRDGNEKPTAGTRSSLTKGGSSAAGSSADSSSPDGTES